MFEKLAPDALFQTDDMPRKRARRKTTRRPPPEAAVMRNSLEGPERVQRQPAAIDRRLLLRLWKSDPPSASRKPAEQDVFALEMFIEPFGSTFTAKARLLDAAERRNFRRDHTSLMPTMPASSASATRHAAEIWR